MQIKIKSIAFAALALALLLLPMQFVGANPLAPQPTAPDFTVPDPVAEALTVATAAPINANLHLSAFAFQAVDNDTVLLQSAEFRLEAEPNFAAVDDLLSYLLTGAFDTITYTTINLVKPILGEHQRV